MTFIASATANIPGTTPPAPASLTAGVQSELVNAFAGGAATLAPQTPVPGAAPQLDPTSAGSPAPTVDMSQSVHPTLVH
jgi:hypothetical protein